MDRRSTASRTDPEHHWVPGSYDSLAERVRADGHPVAVFTPPRLVIVAPDRRGLLVAVAGVLAEHDLDIRRADVTVKDDIAVDVFVVHSPTPAGPTVERLTDDLDAVLSGRRALAALPVAAAATPEEAASRLVAPNVSIENWTSDLCTVVEIHATDRPGLLRRLVGVLFDHGLDVVTARVSTYGDAAVDVFSVRGADGGKVTDLAELDALERSLHAAVD